MKHPCTLCGAADHLTVDCPRLKHISHSAPRALATPTPATFLARLELVRKYLANPSTYPDGIDWPNWNQPHELWYTGHETEWQTLVNNLYPPHSPRARPKGLNQSVPVTVTQPVTVTVTQPPAKSENKEVAKNKGGRPRTGKALTPAEKQAAYRARKKSQAKPVP